MTVRACLHGGKGPHVGGNTRLSINLFYLDHVYVIGGVNQLGGLLSLPGRVIRQPGSQFAM